jgi:vacuolar-type H+-ATPase subunit D/Vma8
LPVRAKARERDPPQIVLYSQMPPMPSNSAGRRTPRKIGECAYAALIEELAAHGHTPLHAMGWPSRDIEVTLRAGNVWGIPGTEVSLSGPVERSMAARGTAPPLTGPAAAETASGFERLIELLLEAASREILVRRLGEALTRASRQLHVLDQRLKPDLSARIARVQQVLEEREREDHARLRRLTRRRRTP